MQLTGASQELQSAAFAWGQHFGLAFQALDDLSDLVGTASELGKDCMQDFREGRLSILLYLMRNHATRQEWDEALGIFNCMGIVTPPDRRFLFEIMQRYSLPKHCLVFARDEMAKAGEAIKGLAHHEFLHRGVSEFLQGLQHHAAKLEEQCKALNS
jgi:geranylgeranyl pyrophosphate synthase